MRIVQLTVLLLVLVAVAQSEDDESNHLGNTAKTTIIPIESKALSIDTGSNNSQKNRRNRYLRQTYRPKHRSPPPFGMKNMRRPSPPPLPRNRVKPGRPYPSSKSKYHYHPDNWHQKWTEQNQPSYGPYSAFEDDGIGLEPPYDEYDDGIVDDAWGYNTKKYRYAYEDVMPVSSRYTEKRSPAIRLLPNFQMLEQQHSRDRARPYNDYENWFERAKFAKNYRDYVDLLASKTLVDSLDDPYITSMMADHRFKFANAQRLRNNFKYDDDEYDFSATNDATPLKMKRLLANLMRNAAKDNRDTKDDTGNFISGKMENADVVYSAKYRGTGLNNVKDGDEEKENRDRKVDAGASQNTLTDTKDWKFFQQPIYQAFQSNEATTTEGKRYKSNRLLPNELIAYMSADPTESVIGKEERYLEAPYSFDVLKSSRLRKMSPISDDSLDIIFNERLDDWKH